MKLCVIIPTYNEAKAVGDLVKRIKQLGYEILVVDDGSSDRTAHIARNAGAEVISNPANCGKGFSLRQGFQYALTRNFEAVAIMDGDGQHDPDDLRYFLEKAENDDADIIMGNRMLEPKNMPGLRRLTNRIMSWIVSGLCGQKIPDSQCGFRLIKSEVLKNIKLFSCRYEIESEMLIAAGKAGYKIVSIPIKSIYQDELSYINPFIDTIRFLRLILKRL